MPVLQELNAGPQRPKPKGFIWPSYAGVVMAITFTLFFVMTYVGPLGYALTATLGGLLLIGSWRHIGRVGWLALIVIGMIAWIVFKSSLLHDFQSGADFSQYETWEAQAGLKMILQPLFYGALVLGALRMRPADASWLMRLVLYGFLAIGVLVAFDALSQARLYQYLSALTYKPIRPDLAMVKLAQASYALVLLFWPLMLFSHVRSRNIALVAFAACILTPLVTGANAPVLALIVSTVVFFTARRFPCILNISVYHWCAFLVALKLLFFPIIINVLKLTGAMDGLKQVLPPSWDARVDIWMFAAEKIMQKPFLGWGFNSSRHFGEAIPLHPHNMSIQVALELGFIGLFLLTAFWVLLILRIGRAPVEAPPMPASEGLSDLHETRIVDVRPYALATTMTFFTLASLSFGIWQEWWLALAAITACVMILTQKVVVSNANVSN